MGRNRQETHVRRHWPQSGTGADRRNGTLRIFRRPAVRLGWLALLLATAAVLPVGAQTGKTWKVFIVTDTMLEKFVEVADGFKAALDRQLAADGARAAYTTLDTKLDPATAAAIVQSIKEAKPDLVCTINWPSAFADINVSLKLPGDKYRFVSLNAIPVQSGVAKTWQKPGGNITGIGVFLQFDSMIKVMEKINPKVNRLYFFTWDAMTALNQYFEAEIRAACLRERIELAEFKKVASDEDQFAYMAKIDQSGPGGMAVGGVSAWVHKDGSPTDITQAEAEFAAKNIRHLPFVSYDEAAIRSEAPIGTCVVWYDLGQQLADKGYKVLKGAKAGDLAWDYPRKFNLMFNLAAARQIGLTIPDSLLTAAYRVYTDFDGHFIGQKN